MKKTGKILALSLAFALCAGGTACFTACDNGDNNSLHTTHTFNNEWEHDDNSHWQLCTECGEKAHVAKHSFGTDGKCTTCGMTDPNYGKAPELPPAEYNPDTDDRETPGLKYTELKNESGEVIGYRVGPGEEFDPMTEELYIPQRHEGKPVLCIGIDPDTYKELSESGKSEAELTQFYQENCFYNNAFLTTVHMGREVENIGVSAFSLCSSLEYVNFPERLKSIDSMAFGGCQKLTDVELPNLQLKTIGFHAFDACAALTELVLPDTVTTIDVGAFWNAISLQSITLSKRLESIGGYGFYNCMSLKEISFPDSLQTIGDHAFNTAGLTKVDFGEGVGTIGQYAFFHCQQLTSIELPDSVYEIGERCFSENFLPNSVDEGGDGIPTGLTHVKIGRGLEKIAPYAFWANYALETVELTGTKVIGEQAFSACQKLTSINFGDSLEKIESGAFWSDSGLTEISFPDSIIEIGSGSFSGCTGLIKVEVGKNISSIGDRAFDRCANIEDVIYHGTYEEWKEYVRNEGGLPQPNICTGDGGSGGSGDGE